MRASTRSARDGKNDVPEPQPAAPRHLLLVDVHSASLLAQTYTVTSALGEIIQFGQ